MKKNWVRFTCFCLLFSLLFYWVNSATRVSFWRWEDFYKIPRDTLDVVFIGNSHSGYTFQPRIIDDVIDINSYSIGIDGENIFISYYELREVLKYQKPKLVVLETFTMNLSEPVEPAIIFPFTDSGHLDLNKMAVMARFLPLDMVHTVFPSLRTHIDWNHPGDFIDNMTRLFKPTNREIDSDRGASLVPDPMSVNEYLEAQNALAVTANPSTEENKKYLDKFVALCKDKDVQLILVTAPIIKITGKHFKYFTAFDTASYARENNIDLITFDTSNFNKLHYANADHVSVFGSVIVSYEMAQIIADQLKIPVDQEQVDYYQSYFFSSYTTTRQGDLFTLTLVPEDPDAELIYKFTLMTPEFIKVMSTEWQPNGQFQFTLENKKNTIRVQILNPDGDYQIYGYFYANK